MYCKYCGKQIDDNSQYCKFCGKKLVETHNYVIDFSNLNLIESIKTKSNKLYSKCFARCKKKGIFFQCFLIFIIGTLAAGVFPCSVFMCIDNRIVAFSLWIIGSMMFGAYCTYMFYTSEKEIEEYSKHLSDS